MPLSAIKSLLMQIATLFLHLLHCDFPPISAVTFSAVTLERTRSMSLLFSALQCISQTDEATQRIIEINSNFNPELHLDQYTNRSDVELLLQYVNKTQGPEQAKNDDPFTNSAEHIFQLSLILNTLYTNTENFPLFYNTSVWLIDRVNSAQLFWSLMVVSAEKYSDTVVTPSAVEVFPQLFIDKREVAKVAGITLPEYDNNEVHPLQYFVGDPGLNEFHTHWHIDNPFWWNETKYGVKRDRRGELFFYMHHQILARYQAELLSNGLDDVAPLELDPDYTLPEAYYPDIVNVNYRSFPPRNKGDKMGDFDDGKSLKELKTYYNRLNKGIEQGYFMRKDGSHESLQYENGSSIVGSTAEASPMHSANLGYYGSFHNYLHRLLGRLVKPQGPTPGVQAHSETALRDPVFFRLHKLVDALYYKFKMQATPYTRHDLDYPGVQIKFLEVQLKQRGGYAPRWPPKLFPSSQPIVLSTYFNWDKYDISTAARPCRGVGEEPAVIKVKTLDHAPFNYVISLKSTKNSIAHGMVRIFLLPEFAQDGSRFEYEESHQRAIELDRFRIQLEPNKEMILTRSSTDSSITREAAQPRIKALYDWTSSPESDGANQLLRPKMTRACGFPHNLLIPKGNKDGMRFKLTVMVSEEQEHGEGTGSEYPNYPYCGALNGFHYPDSRPMGFPFDRPGTRFISYEGIWIILGGYAYKNVRHVPVVIKHLEK